MNIRPIVSVIIPTYNGGKYICQTIESVLNQTFSDIEILVVDDGSSEDLSVLLQPYAGQIQYIYKNNSGPADTRNAGIKLSRGKYIALLDHDDLWHRDKLKVQVELLEKNPLCALVYSYPTLIDGDDRIIPHERPTRFPSGRVFLDFLQRNWITTFSAALFKREILDTVGLLDDSPQALICDDYDLWLRIADVAEVIFAPGDLVQYRVHAGNLAKKHDQHLSADLFVFEKALANSKTLQNDPSRIGAIRTEHLYHKYRRFAFIYYYKAGDVTKARQLLWKMIRLKPQEIGHLRYLLAWYAPESIKELVRKITRRVETGGDCSESGNGS